MNSAMPANLDWQKQSGLLPAVVQDSRTDEVLMLAYMNEEALAKTLATGDVHFFSRSRRCLWRKGETSGNFLKLESIAKDCDGDTLLVRAKPAGPVCHTGERTCFEDANPVGFLKILEGTISARRDAGSADSYTARLLSEGIPQIARKVGEEAVEVAMAAVTEDDAALVGEAADLVYHLMVLLNSRDLSLRDVEDCLAARHQSRKEDAPAG
ncbi:MAG: bifunctional phosphoribosyl-AMP cyclohydrolase/phosphoribosyl-ATP diphosphatase HisIE [Gammaproteobacteria bacterium]|nr:bifunctional phosphoribosyl-AMP cyclohydrolase/phosphoribosyl-ATP diphosphatase HisIE [Gammaproteobacteria bacterium]